MLVDLSDVANDVDIGDAVTITRTPGTYGAGGWVQGAPFPIPAYGPIGIAEDEALLQVPEADRVTGSLQFVTVTPIYKTMAGQTSDTIIWLGNVYRVISVAPWKHAGFYSAILVREKGD